MKDAPLYIVSLREDLLEACAAIAATAPDPWTREGLAACLASAHQPVFVALDPAGQPLGFAAFLLANSVADLALLAVAPAARRQRVARRLLAHALGQLAEVNIQQVLLEVRASNSAALPLYEGLGFTRLALRPALFSHPREDGWMMALPLAAEAKYEDHEDKGYATTGNEPP